VTVDVAIVAAWETDHSAELSEPLADLHEMAVVEAVRRAGIEPAAVDGVACPTHSPVELGAALGLDVRWIDSTYIGNCSALIHLRRAAAAIADKMASTVVISGAESLRSRSGLLWFEAPTNAASMIGQFEAPYAPGPQGRFALHLHRYMTEWHVTEHDLASESIIRWLFEQRRK